MQDKPADYYLDITSDVCPMTFVKTRLLVERMAPGETADVLLRGEEPISNVPRSLKELGHTVELMVPAGTEEVPDAVRLRVRKSATGR